MVTRLFRNSNVQICEDFVHMYISRCNLLSTILCNLKNSQNHARGRKISLEISIL